jgi:hypothetical protein
MGKQSALLKRNNGMAQKIEMFLPVKVLALSARLPL